MFQPNGARTPPHVLRPRVTARARARSAPFRHGGFEAASEWHPRQMALAVNRSPKAADASWVSPAPIHWAAMLIAYAHTRRASSPACALVPTPIATRCHFCSRLDCPHPLALSPRANPGSGLPCTTSTTGGDESRQHRRCFRRCARNAHANAARPIGDVYMTVAPSPSPHARACQP